MSKINYHKVGDYYYPNLIATNHNVNLTRYGRKLLQYIEENEYPFYFKMLCEGTLWKYLEQMDQQMNETYDLLVEQFQQRRGITEELKKQDQMQWVREMNNIAHCVNEIIYNDYIYHKGT